MISIKIVYKDMINRCYNPKATRYADYGTRGIIVCESWKSSFDNFAKDMGERPEGFQLERKDNNSNYEPSNCCWASRIQQQNNRRNNVRLNVNGTNLTVAEWSRKIGISHDTILYRLKSGWSEEKTIITPLKKQYSRLHNFKNL